jgi:excisionase family DNA binding protein
MLMKSPHQSTEWLTQNEVAELLKISPRTLERWRCKDDGPPFHYFGRLVRYSDVEVNQWAVAGRRNSTSEGGR